MPPIISVDALVKRYRKATANAVDDVSFAVEPGELFALLGPNGAGKTTTISILTTTLLMTSGRVTIAGRDVDREASAVRRSVGIIFQRPSFDQNLTAEENVRFHAILYGMYPFRPTYSLMPRDYKARVSELAAVLGIENEMGKAMKTFSGGTKRKLEIVRGLIHRPPVLFLDEPTVGLDPSSRRSLWEYLARVRTESGTTIFLTTHYLDEAEQADKICIINRGRVVAYGTPDSVKATLVQEYVTVDAAEQERAALRTELAALGARTEGDGPFKVFLGGPAVHPVLRQVRTPLTLIRSHAPTLEDAYLAIVTPELAVVSTVDAAENVTEPSLVA